MADKVIASAVQKGSFVYVYDENGHTLFSKQGTLGGFTSATVTVIKGSWAYTYDAKGHTKFSKQMR